LSNYARLETGEATESTTLGRVMTDVFSIKKRSAIMSRVRSKGNEATELKLILLLKKWQLTGWRRNYPIFGHPDFVFPKCRLAVFVDGCFWHACPHHGTQPQSNRHFWARKIGRNIARDRLVARTLRGKGWRVLRIWQHELTRKSEIRCANRLRVAVAKAASAVNYEYRSLL
jgi:DNA mismatch endonuclease (patch repair protein)